MLATLEFPDVDGPVIAATGQHTSIGTDLESLHDPLMCLSHQHTLSALDLPPTQPPVTASTDQHLPTQTPSHRKGHSWMLRQGLHPLPAVRLPHEDFPAFSATRGVPHIDDAIIASTD